MEGDLAAGCYTCEQERTESPPPREDVLHTGHWRVAHAFDTSLPGWLVVVPVRHVLSFSELDAGAADELGGLVRRLSRALEEVTGCVKTYLMQFSEADGFSHLHLHLVPRMPDHPEGTRGPRVFAYLHDEEAVAMSAAARDEVALALRSALEAIGRTGAAGCRVAGGESEW